MFDDPVPRGGRQKIDNGRMNLAGAANDQPSFRC
jgi:hypothetical protein